MISGAIASFWKLLTYLCLIVVVFIHLSSANFLNNIVEVLWFKFMAFN